MHDTKVIENFDTSPERETVKMHNTKVIENFDTSPKSINIPLYDQRFRSYSHFKLRGASRNQF
jgi:hypothetical protein